MTKEQMAAFRKTLIYLSEKSSWPEEFHHGDCLGADDQAATMFHQEFPTLPIYSYPCNIDGKRAFNKYSTPVQLPKPPLVRNHDIVNAVGYMIGTPKGFFEEQRSGTWATIRYSKKSHKPLLIIKPDGLFLLSN